MRINDVALDAGLTALLNLTLSCEVLLVHERIVCLVSLIKSRNMAVRSTDV